jgi:putative salt-induced outer membrane protein YdiY
MRYSKYLPLFYIVVFLPNLHADELLLKNGDRLTGKIQRLVEGKLVFKPDVAEDITIDISSVETFSSDLPIELNLKDGTILNQKAIEAEPNRFAIEGSDTVQPQTFELANLMSINPPEKPKPKWTGNISAGLTATQGNTSTDSVNASINLTRRSEKDRTKLTADYAKGRQEDPDTEVKKTTEDWWRIKAKYDYFFSKKLYGYLDGRYEKDSIAQLDRRVVLGGGAGYQWIESDDMNLSTEAGLASVYEKFDNQTSSNSELSIQLGYNFDKKLYKSIMFLHDLTYYPSTDNFSNYYLTTTAELRTYFTERMFANFKAIYNYDATPAMGAGNTDVKYILSVGLSF